MKAICLLGISCLIILWGLTACLDHRNETEGKTYKLTGYAELGTRGTRASTTFDYNNDNRLASYTYTSGFSSPRITTYAYDAQGRLANSQATGYYLTYAYDASGNITTINRYDSKPTSSSAVPTSITSMIYSASKCPDQIITTSGSTTTVVSYTYVAGNIARRTIKAADATAGQEVTYQYGNDPNPFYGMVLPLAPFGSNISYNGGVDTFSRNAAITGDGTADYKITYIVRNSAGLITERESQIGLTNLISVRELFFYK